MASLFGVFSTAVQSLAAEQGALSATTDNIANVNTPGFTRRRPVFSEEVPVVEQGITYGRGVRLDNIESIRDEMLELRLDAEAQQHGAAEAKSTALQPIDSLLSDLDNGISARLGAFFDSLNGLAAQPASIPLRQSVLTAASNLANGFNQTSQKLNEMRSNLDYQVAQSIAEVNQSIATIASLNSEVTRMKSTGGDPSTYEDERTAAVRQLSELADVAIVQSDDGLTITTSHGTALVVGGSAYPIQAVADADGHQRVQGDGRDITAEFLGGRLGALISVRDQDAAQAISDLDNVAFGLATAINNVHRQGFALDADPGVDMFSIGTSAAGSAAAIRLAISDPGAIAASSNGDAGSSGNLDALGRLRTATIIHDQSAADVLSEVSFRIGSATADSQAQVEASETIQDQLAKQRNAISGVSLDEEAANLMRYQRAYQAAARVIDAADQMLQIACNLGQE